MTVVQRLVQISCPYRKHLYVGFLAMYISIVLDIFTSSACYPALIWLVINGGAKGMFDHLPAIIIAGFNLTHHIQQFILPFTSWQLFMWTSILTIVTIFIKCGCDARQSFLMNKFSNLMSLDLRQRLFGHLLALSPRYFEDKTTGAQLSRITSDVVMLQSALGPQLADIIRAPITVVFSIITMFLLSWRLTLVTLGLVPAILLIYWLAGVAVRKQSMNMQDRLAELNGFLVERLGNIRMIQSFTQEGHEMAQADKMNQRYYQSVIRGILIMETMNPAIEFIASVGMITGIIIGGLAVLRGDMPSLYFVSFLAVAQKGGSNFKMLSRVNQVRMAIEGMGARLFEMLDTPSDIQDTPSALVLPSVTGQITFDQVHFRYATGDSVLAEINIDVNPGEVIALVGPSGAGKTTMVSLVPRFYDPTNGRILVDGHDIRNITVQSLRRQIGTVPQESVLFSESIFNNILYGRLDASQEEVVAAAKAANALEFIEKLPEGFETLVGERGARLSGGQRQRVAIARALLRNPRILILDEATSALDTESEHLVQQALERLMQGRTTFVIAHRLSTVQHASRILVMAQGRIVEVGTHQELLSRGGLYQRLYEMQFKPRRGHEAVELSSS